MSDRPNAPRFDPESEVRFALVMYGGVSLAIYMNGIAQELLRVVRATAPRQKPGVVPPEDDTQMLLAHDDLDATEHIYRRIAQHLDAGRWDPAALATDSPDAPVRCRLVIDIISGTSAGGINGVFLAKALATGESIERLAGLWVEEGAIEHLINDNESRFDRSPRPKFPSSLLNSRRMYRKLVDAFDDMDDDADPGITAPLVHQVDLFVTTTDIVGLPIALRLSDRVVAERRHRNVFHLRYEDGSHGVKCDDFERANNPFLAFISRCTSSFPFAFEPMTLADIDPVLEARGKRTRPRRVESDGKPWRRFFPAYTGDADDQVSVNDANETEARFESAEPWVRDGGPSIAQRAFGDGGYLDNKPFEYAIGALTGRRTNLPTQRKLLYVEPSPEHPELDAAPGTRPNAIENVNAALSLARYETIRNDLERVLTRNNLVERVGRIVQGIDEDLARRDARRPAAKQRVEPSQTDAAQVTPEYLSDQYGTLDLAAMIEQHGIAYGGYHRLKVSALTDEIAEYVARVSKFNEQSDEFQAIRHLVAAWRDRNYAPYLTDGARNAKLKSENEFSLCYDLNFRIRRLTFVLGRCDVLLAASDAELQTMLGHRRLAIDATNESRAIFENTLRELRHELAPCVTRLRDLRLSLLGRDASVNPLGDAVHGLRIRREEMLRVLNPPTVQERVAEAAKLLDERQLWTAMEQIAKRLAAVIAERTIPASKLCSQQLPPPPVGMTEPSDTAGVARAILRWYYWDYERYDQLIFPAFFSTEVGEEMTLVDVLRASPEDARSLIDESAASEPRRKLAGNALMHFGAFLDRRWRWNDIMWGRLDGAERLIMGLLSGAGPDRDALRSALVNEVHGAILEDELRKPEAEPFTWATAAEQTEIHKLLTLPPDAPAADRHAARERVRLIFKKSYRTPPGPGAQASATAAARATRVVGQMLDGMTEQYAILERPAAWLTRLGSIAWGIVEVAVPQSMRNLVVTHAFKLLYTLEALLVGIGVLLNDTIRNFGLQVFAVTLAGHLTVLLVRDLFSSRTSWMRRVVGLLALGVAIVATVGGLALFDASLRDAVSQYVFASGGPLRFAATLVAVFGVLVLALRIGAAKVWRFLGGSPSAEAIAAAAESEPAGIMAKILKPRRPGRKQYDRRSGGLDSQRLPRDVHPHQEEYESR